MTDSLEERPFDGFKTAITDPVHFFGRRDLIQNIQRSPFRVRILLGGRRIGKTSTLRAIEWSLLDANSSQPRRAFPVFLDLQVEQPQSLANFRYLLIARLREAIERWQNVPGATIREMYRQFLRQVSSGEVTVSFLSTINTKLSISNPDRDRQLIHDDFRQSLLKTIEELHKWKFEGVCFLLDEAEFIVCRDWANDAWSYFRGLKDSDTALKSCLGLLISGYRNLKNYQQDVGSPLFNIAEPAEWLTTLTESETQELIFKRSQSERLQLTQRASFVIEQAGCHPYLTQQVLNLLSDNTRNKKYNSLASWLSNLLKRHNHDFSVWWNEGQESDGFSDIDQTVYRAFVECRQGTPMTLCKITNLSEAKVLDSIEMLEGTGVIRRMDEENYTIGTRLFEKWISQRDLE